MDGIKYKVFAIDESFEVETNKQQLRRILELIQFQGGDIAEKRLRTKPIAPHDASAQAVARAVVELVQEYGFKIRAYEGEDCGCVIEDGTNTAFISNDTMEVK